MALTGYLGAGLKFPVLRKQRVDQRCWRGIDADQNVFQPLTVVDSISLAGRGEGEEDRQILSASLASDEKPVASSDCNSSHLNLGGIIVKIQFGIIKELFELVFNIQRISCGFCQ